MNVDRNQWNRVLLHGALLVAVAGIIGYGPPVLAQEQQPEQEAEQPAAPTFEDEVEVTGTLIPRPTLDAMSPVSTLDIEELTYRGVTRLEDLLTSLPQIFAAQNSIITNGASGTATVDLRNLGARPHDGSHRRSPDDAGRRSEPLRSGAT